jgi:hypothetical protein
MIIAQKMTEVAPFAGTVLGWEVKGITEVVRALHERGVTFERYQGVDQDDLGIWKSPPGEGRLVQGSGRERALSIGALGRADGYV